MGRTLRRYRENLGCTLDDAARILECDRSKISRIETGERGIRAKELRELLAEYGVADEQQAVLALLADPRGAFGWHRDYADVLPGAWRDYLILETAASKISGYDAQRVPGLLQTPAYARALAETDPSLHDDAARDQAAEAVLARQQAILDEARAGAAPGHRAGGPAPAGRQPGGNETSSSPCWPRPPATAARSPCRFCRSSPARTRRRATARWLILQFDGAPGLGLVHLGGIGGGVCLEGQDDLAAYAAGVRPAARVRAQPRAVRAAAARPGRRLTPLIRRRSRRASAAGAPARPAGRQSPR